MYLLLTDRFPLEIPEEIGDLNRKMFDQPVIPPSRLNVAADPSLDQIVMRAMERDPKRRYDGANELLRDLDSWTPQKPVAAATKTTATLGSSSKLALGAHSPVNEERARERARRACQLARESGKLAEAADLLEEAFNKWPALRSELENQVKLWRRGIAM